MTRSAAFPKQERLHGWNTESFLKPTLLSDASLFLRVDLEDPIPKETKMVLNDIFNFRPPSIEDGVMRSLRTELADGHIGASRLPQSLDPRTAAVPLISR